jgi:hypothetical protein
VLADVESTLALITTTSTLGDFYTTVKRVHSMDRGPMETHELPAIVIVNHGSPRHYGDMLGNMDATLTLEVYALLKKDTNWRRDINRFAADIEKALRVDEQRGQFANNANAFDTTIQNIDVANETDGFPVALARIDVQVQFRYLTNDPTIAA